MSAPVAAPTLVLLAACARNGVIGREGHLPWRLPEDLRRFRRLTLGRTVLMGRKTFESLGKPLDGRDNWVLSRDAGYAPAGTRVFRSLDEAIRAGGSGELMVIGGAELYRQTLPLAARLELTEVHAEVEGDTRFPDFDRRRWCETERDDRPADERHAYPYSFITLVRQP